MGITIEIWRARIGTFTNPSSRKKTCLTTSASGHYLSLCIRTLLFFLLAAQCVERNPGPTSGRGRGGGRGGRTSTVASLSTHDFDSSQNNVLNDVGHTYSTRSSSQSSLASWLQPESTSQASNFTQGPLTSPQPLQDTHTDDINVTSILLDIRSELRHINRRFDMLEKSVDDIKHENSQIKAENVILSGKVDSLTAELKAVKDQSSQSELRQERMEMQMRKNNLKIHGIENIDTLQQEHVDQSVRQHLTNNFGIDGNSLELNAAYKLPGRGDRAVLVKFARQSDRDKVLNAYKLKRKNEPVRGRIVEDLPERVVKSRTGLYPFLKQCYDEGKSAFFKYDKLIVDGESYIYDPVGKKPVLERK